MNDVTRTSKEQLAEAAQAAADSWWPSTQNHDPSLIRSLRSAFAAGFVTGASQPGCGCIQQGYQDIDCPTHGIDATALRPGPIEFVPTHEPPAEQPSVSEIIRQMRGRAAVSDAGGTIEVLLTDLRSVVTKAQRHAQSPSDRIFPIARLTIAEDDSVTATMYTPGLPPGEHDVYPAAPSQPPGNDAEDAARWRWFRENPAFETETALSMCTPELVDRLLDEQRLGPTKESE